MLKTALLATAATALALTTAVPAQAAQPITYRYSTTGGSAEALFSDAPFDGSTLDPRKTYHDTYVGGGQSATRSDGTTSAGSYAFLDQIAYTVDRRGSFVLVSETFGYADGAAVAFTEDKKLTGATLRATVATTVCDGSYTCKDGSAQAVSVDWTGTGDITHQVGNYVLRNRTLRINSHQNGYFRNATATGFGTSVFADLFSGKYTDRCAGSGC